MDKTSVLDRKLETLAWGLLFVFWGISIFFDRIPFGVGVVGTGVILLGLNLARAVNGISMRGLTIILGILSLVWGGLELARPIAARLLHLPFQLNDWAIFAILLVVVGVMVLVAAVLRIGETHADDLHQHS